MSKMNSAATRRKLRTAQVSPIGREVKGPTTAEQAQAQKTLVDKVQKYTVSAACSMQCSMRMHDRLTKTLDKEFLTGGAQLGTGELVTTCTGGPQCLQHSGQSLYYSRPLGQGHG